MQVFIPMAKVPTVTHHDKKIHAFMRGGKPCAVLHDTPELKATKAKLHALLAPYAPEQPMTGPVRLVVKWCFPLDGKHRDGDWKTTKPDTDNLDKALKDQLTRLGYWHDDAQVCSEISEKFYSATPGLFLRVEGL